MDKLFRLALVPALGSGPTFAINVAAPSRVEAEQRAKAFAASCGYRNYVTQTERRQRRSA